MTTMKRSSVILFRLPLDGPGALATRGHGGFQWDRCGSRVVGGGLKGIPHGRIGTRDCHGANNGWKFGLFHD